MYSFAPEGGGVGVVVADEDVSFFGRQPSSSIHEYVVKCRTLLSFSAGILLAAVL